MFCAQFVSLEEATDIDLVRFDGLYNACERLYGKVIHDRAKVYIACAQAEEKILDERLKRYTSKQLISTGGDKGTKDFLMAHGKGF